MLKKIGETKPPTGFRKLLFRAPIHMYHWRLGFLMGGRFVLLKHRGRKSGSTREAVIEVIDGDLAQGKLYAASGFGEQSQWFKNICANNHVKLTWKNEHFAAQARILEVKEAEQVLLRYASAHPKSIRAVARLSGYQMDGDHEDVSQFSRIIRVVEFSRLE